MAAATVRLIVPSPRNREGEKCETGTDAAEIIGPAFADDGATEVEFEIPSGSGNMVLVFSRNASDEFWGLGASNSGNIDIIRQGAGTPFWQTQAAVTGTVNAQTKYIARIVRNQRHVDFGVFNTNGAAVATESYNATEDFGEGLFGLLTATENMVFDDFSFTRLDRPPASTLAFAVRIVGTFSHPRFMRRGRGPVGLLWRGGTGDQERQPLGRS